MAAHVPCAPPMRIGRSVRDSRPTRVMTEPPPRSLGFALAPLQSPPAALPAAHPVVSANLHVFVRGRARTVDESEHADGSSARCRRQQRWDHNAGIATQHTMTRKGQGQSTDAPQGGARAAGPSGLSPLLSYSSPGSNPALHASWSRRTSRPPPFPSPSSRQLLRHGAQC